MESSRTVLHRGMGGGPHGVGDPDDKRLRKVEMDVLIPKKLRERTRAEKCVDQVAAFGDCCTKNGFTFVVRCRTENTNLRSCLETWYNDTAFKEECKEEYLRERSEYRRTGIGKATKRMTSAV